MRSISISLIFLCVFLAGCVERDAAGQLPTEIAAEFVKQVNAGDYTRAAGFWRENDTDAVEINFHMSFKDFCVQNFSSDSFCVEYSHAEKGYAFVGFIGVKEGKEKRHTLALEIVNGHWKLVDSPNTSWAQKAFDERQAAKKALREKQAADDANQPPPPLETDQVRIESGSNAP